MQLVYQEDWVPMKPSKTIFQNDFQPPLAISLKDWGISGEKTVLWSPNWHIFKMAAIHILEMIIGITQ